MLEEEIKVGEQEREALRIEAQRLRDELSDLRIEAEIVQEKLRLAEETIERHHQRKQGQIGANGLRPPSPLSETATSATSMSSPTASTPPLPNSDVSALQATPPSPPLSDAPVRPLMPPSTPLQREQRTVSNTSTASTRKPGQSSIRPPRHSRGPSIPTSASGRPSIAPRSRVPSRPSMGGMEQPPLPRSGSLYQIRGLIGKVQKLEERVHTVRSKLPAPTSTPPRASPRSSALGHHPSNSTNAIPATVTVRSNRRNRISTSTANSSASSQSQPAAPPPRLSLGGAASTPSAIPRADSRQSRPSSRQSRPSSRASVSSRPDFSASVHTIRPGSRTSVGGARTPQLARPRSSISGTFAAPRPPSAAGTASATNAASTPTPARPAHAYSGSFAASVGRPRPASSAALSPPGGPDEDDDEDGFATPTQTPLLASTNGRRATLDKGFSGIPTPSGLPRRQSGVAGTAAGVRKERVSGVGVGDTF